MDEHKSKNKTDINQNIIRRNMRKSPVILTIPDYVELVNKIAYEKYLDTHRHEAVDKYTFLDDYLELSLDVPSKLDSAGITCYQFGSETRLPTMKKCSSIANAIKYYNIYEDLNEHYGSEEEETCLHKIVIDDSDSDSDSDNSSDALPNRTVYKLGSVMDKAVDKADKDIAKNQKK